MSRDGATPGLVLAVGQTGLSPANRATAAWNKDGVWIGRYNPTVINNLSLHHYVATYVGGSTVGSSMFTVWVDGTLAANVAVPNTGSDSSTSLTSGYLILGANNNTSPTTSNITIAKFAAYNYTLGADRIAAHYAAGNALSGVWGWVD